MGLWLFSRWAHSGISQAPRLPTASDLFAPHKTSTFVGPHQQPPARIDSGSYAYSPSAPGCARCIRACAMQPDALKNTKCSATRMALRTQNAERFDGDAPLCPPSMPPEETLQYRHGRRVAPLGSGDLDLTPIATQQHSQEREARLHVGRAVPHLDTERLSRGVKAAGRKGDMFNQSMTMRFRCVLPFGVVSRAPHLLSKPLRSKRHVCAIVLMACLKAPDVVQSTGSRVTLRKLPAMPLRKP